MFPIFELSPVFFMYHYRQAESPGPAVKVIPLVYMAHFPSRIRLVPTEDKCQMPRNRLSSNYWKSIWLSHFT